MLSSNLKECRKAKGLTQEEFAAKLHVVRQTVSKWETGLSAPDAETLIHISEVLEVPVEVLLGETVAFSEGQTEVAAIAEKLTVINEQLARAAEQKRKAMRMLSVVGLTAVLVLTAWIVLSAVFLHRPSELAMSNPNIIGGADGPTRLLVVSRVSPAAGVIAVIVLAVSAIGIRLSRK